MVHYQYCIITVNTHINVSNMYIYILFIIANKRGYNNNSNILKSKSDANSPTYHTNYTNIQNNKDDSFN